MDFIDKLRELSSKVPKLKETGLVKTEEGAKNALVMPFINALGYNVFDPSEVTPELTADIGTKKGEKVDYAIIYEGKPIILVECKGFGVDLNTVHASQLYRYFSVTAARFGVLTNGITHKFFSDLEAANKMDDKPFFTFDLTDINEPAVEALKKFSKSTFDQERIITTASELKYRGAIKKFISEQFAEPSEDFVKICLKDAYSGRFTQSAIEELTPITRDALRSFISDQVEKRLKTALATETASQTAEEEEETTAQESTPSQSEPETDESNAKIITTQEEYDAYYTIKAIVRDVIDVKRVFMRDAQSYCSILVDDNNRRALCRLRFNATQKYIGILDEDKNEDRHPIESLDDLYQYADPLRKRAKHFLEE